MVPFTIKVPHMLCAIFLSLGGADVAFIHLRRLCSLNTRPSASVRPRGTNLARIAAKRRTRPLLIELKWIQLDLCITLPDSVLLRTVNRGSGEGNAGRRDGSLYTVR